MAHPRVRDVAVCGFILAFGVLQFFFSDRIADFLRDDVFYADAARSLLQHGLYGIQNHPETNQPPGLSAILALLCLAGGCSHAVFLRAMAVFQTLGLLAGYALLRRHAPRIVAAAICLLLISSPIWFSSVTRSVLPSAPYLFTTMSAFLVARRLENAASLRARLAWGALLTGLCVASLMIASAAIALLGAMVIRIGITFFRDRRLAVARLRAYLVVILVGTAVQGAWMLRRPAPFEWSLPGYPHPYLSQLKVKDGNDPELGMATLRDIPVRIGHNAEDDTALLVDLLVRRSMNVAWMSVAIMIPLLLILLGWLASVRQAGGELHDWYFAGYQVIYLLWPWNFETRFFLPVAPLACLYLWRGVQALGFLARNKSRLLGAAWLPASLVLAFSAWRWTQGAVVSRHLLHPSLQDEASLVTWVLSAIVAAWMAWAGSGWWTQASPVLQWSSRPKRALQLLAAVGVIGLIITGLGQQIALGRENVDLASVVNEVPPDPKAAMWIDSHTDTGAVIMARQVPTAYHYSRRRVVWFPPSSNPQLLMDGIRRLHVDYVVVVHRQYSYYLPPDDDCFAPLLAAYPEAFRLAFQAPEFRVFLVLERDQRLPGVKSLRQSFRRA